MIGQQIGPYAVLSKLGAGGMGEVYRATDTNLKRTVAIKVLPDAFASDAERLARFQREAETLARLNHPNIAHIHGIERHGGSIALVMELVEGPTLADVIARSVTPDAESVSSRPRDSEAMAKRGGGAPRGLRIDDALHIARQIAEALTSPAASNDQRCTSAATPVASRSPSRPREATAPSGVATAGRCSPRVPSRANQH